MKMQWRWTVVVVALGCRLLQSSGSAHEPKSEELIVKGVLTAKDVKDKVRTSSHCKRQAYEMAEGRTYQIDMKSTELDSYLRLEDPTGEQVAFDDDGGGFPNARILYSPKKSGKFTIVCTTFGGDSTGKFTLHVKDVTTTLGSTSAPDKKPPPYALTLPPLEILERLEKLKVGSAPKRSAAERAFLASVWDGRTQKTKPKIDEAMLLDAMLFSSGVDDAAARKQYRDRYAALMVKVQAALKGAKTPYARGEAVMTFLHKGVMSKGYSLEQTLWTDVFDSGRYNCVSATAMVYLVGTHVGLELKPLSIPGSAWLPGHATLDLLDGKDRLHVEATNPDGFDWQKKISRPGVIVLGFVPDRKGGHEVDGLGVAAMIYSNRGVALGKAKDQDRLLQARLYVGALVLDPSDPTSNNNFLGLFLNWGTDLAKEKKFEDAVGVTELGCALAPKHSGLRGNLRFVWSSYLKNLVETGKDQDVVKVLARAKKTLPDDADFRGVGLFFRMHSQRYLDKKDPDQSLKVLARAYALDPKDRETAAGISFHTQEALAGLFKEKGLKAVIEHYQEMSRLFPDYQDVTAMGWAFALRRIDSLADQKKFTEAGAMVGSLEPIVGKKRLPELGGIAYDRWGRHLTGEKQWKAALATYQEGVKKYPEEKRLVEWAAGAVDTWADTAMSVKNWDEACRIYEIGLKAFPGNGHLLQNLKYCKSKKEKQ